MGAIGSFKRKLDQDLIARIINRVAEPAKPLKRVSEPRERSTYRAARRNEALRRDKETWKGVKPTGRLYHPPARPNRSRKWTGGAA